MPLGPDWRKSTYSGTHTCVEVAHNTDEGVVLVRHSKHPGDGVVVFTRQQWQREVLDVLRDEDDAFYWSRFYPLQFTLDERSAFVQGVMAGEFDLPAEAVRTP